MNSHYKLHKKEAEKIIKDSVMFFAQLYGVSIKRISIRDTKTRWGSCSKLGNLNFSYKLIFLPPHLRNMVIVHEICHLIEFNHSKRFWDLVARVFPDYKEITKKLRTTNIRALK